jgi:hypothetical protein
LYRPVHRSAPRPAPDPRSCTGGCRGGLPARRAGGAKIEAAFLRSIVQETFTIVDLELADYERMAELVEVYADFPLGTTDAAVVAVAERLGVSNIVALDRRHFHAVRPRHIGSFQLLP